MMKSSIRKNVLLIFIVSVVASFYYTYALNSLVLDQTKTEKMSDNNNTDDNNNKLEIFFLSKRLTPKSDSYHCTILHTQLTSLYGKFPYLVSAPKTGSSDIHYFIYDGVTRSLNTTFKFEMERIHATLNELHTKYDTKSDIQKQALDHIPIFGHSVEFTNWRTPTSDLIDFHNCVLEFFALVSKNNQIGGSTYRDPREAVLSTYFHELKHNNKNKYEKYDFQMLLKYMIFNQIVFNIKPNLAFLFSLNEFAEDKLRVGNEMILLYNFTATVHTKKKKQLKYGNHQTWREEWKQSEILEASCLIQKLTPSEIYQNYVPKSQYEIEVSSDCLPQIIEANHAKDKRKSLDQFIQIVSSYSSIIIKN